MSEIKDNQVNLIDSLCRLASIVWWWFFCYLFFTPFFNYLKKCLGETDDLILAKFLVAFVFGYIIYALTKIYDLIQNQNQ